MTKKAIILFDPNSGQHKHQWYREAAEKEKAKDYCLKLGIEPFEIISFSESYYLFSKYVFSKATDIANSSSESIAIVTDKVSRLQYFCKQAEAVDKLIKEGRLELHFYEEGKVIAKNSEPKERMPWDIFAMLASCYYKVFEENYTGNWEHDDNTDDNEPDNDNVNLNDSLTELQFQTAKEIFNSLELEPQKLPKLISCVKFASEMEQGASNHDIRQLYSEYIETKSNMYNITEEFLNSDITRKDFRGKYKPLAKTQRELVRELIKHTRAEEVFSDCLTDMAELYYMAAEGFKHSTTEEKRQLINLVFERAEVHKSRMEYTLNPAARLLLKYKANS